MAGSINKAIILGNVGKNPEIRSMQSGDKVASFSVATSESWKDKNGEKQERTQWHNVSCFNQGLIKVIESYVSKGTKIYIEGQLETRKWSDKDGNDRYTTEIVLKPYRGELVLLGGNDKRESKSEDPENDDDYYGDQVQNGEASSGGDFDDEVPWG